MMQILLVAIASLVAGGLLSYLLLQLLGLRKKKAAEKQAEEILARARARDKESLLEAKEEGIRLRTQAEAESRERRAELGRTERRASQKEETLERRREGLDRRDRQLQDREKEIQSLKNQIEDVKKKHTQELEAVAGLTGQEARAVLLKELEGEVREEASRKVRQWEAETRAEGEGRAREVLAQALQRCAQDVVGETTVSVVVLPSDEMKGRLIGREGRNIRALEQATGVELIIDDTPEAVALSSFDPVRREVARIALERLIRDGSIHPARIEEMVEKARAEVEQSMVAAGEEAVVKAGVPGIHPELVKLLGRLKYRTSYGQNVLSHSLEVANLAGLIAAEIGADGRLARKAGLLHDIGKAVDHEVEGTHALIGARLVEQWDRSPQVVQGIAQHHGESDTTSVEGFIVAAADALSGGRPGARAESVERYLQRIKALEDIARSLPGVAEAFAIQAGREVRIMVKPEAVDALEAMRLARDIAKKIEEGLEYPGQIKVTVIRETRAVDIAK